MMNWLASLKLSITNLTILKRITILFLLGFSQLVFAQENRKKIPKKAAIYSAILPGSGQFYTKKYWKIPIIYGGLITSGYYIKESNDLFTLYKNSYSNRISGEVSDNFTM